MLYSEADYSRAYYVGLQTRAVPPARRGGLHSYLGDTLDFDSLPGQVKLTMEGYIRDLLQLYEVRGVVAGYVGSIFYFSRRSRSVI